MEEDQSELTSLPSALPFSPFLYFPSPTQHCIITRIPVEIINQILKCEVVLPSELKAVSQTCRYLRAVGSLLPLGPASSLHFRSKLILHSQS